MATHWFTMLAFFFIVMFIWIFIACVADLFRDHEESGWAKAAWCLFLVIVPLFGVLIYLIVRGQGMRDRSIAEQVEAKKQMDAYIQQTAGSLAGRRAEEAVGPQGRRHDLGRRVRVDEGEARQLAVRPHQ